MKNVLSVLILILMVSNTICSKSTQQELIDNFFEKDSVKILVTDSGLGGMSVAANLYEKIKDAGIFKSVEIIFFNAQPHLTYGYNAMKSGEEKIWVFNNALNAMNEKLNPDMILIACNTLSVIYEDTDFSRGAEIPVIGVVDAGVELIYSKMESEENSKVIIFATKTTVEVGKHKIGLVGKGISEDRIITIPCPRLAGSIERNYNGMETDSLVNFYVLKGIEQLNGSEENIFVSYNCTHYGYVTGQFAEKFEGCGIGVNGYLDPNYNMTDFIFESGFQNRFESTEMTIEIISMPELTPEKIYSIFSLLEKTSEASAEALMFYNYEPGYFDWDYKK